MRRSLCLKIINTCIIVFFLTAYRVTVPAPVSAAGTILVNTTLDVYGGSVCSLRNAVHAANTNVTFGGCPPGNDIQLPAGYYKLTILNPNKTETDESAGDLDITGNMTITGSGSSSTVVYADGKAFGDRIFHIKSGATVTLQKMKINGGYILHNLGAGILNDGGVLKLISTNLDGNVVDLSEIGAGGGIANTSGQLTIDYTTITNNHANQGGGIYNTATISINHSAIYKNIAVTSGGGLDTRNPDGTSMASIANTTIAFNSSTASASGGGISSASTLTITSSTIADNSGGGLSIFDGSPVIQNTIFARNLQPNCGIGSKIGLINVNSLGHNLVDNVNPSDSSQCSFSGPGDNLNQDAQLSMTISSHAGLTMTYGFVKEGTQFSPAIDALPIGDLSCPPDDQRGFVRPVDGNGDGVIACDMGAYEERELYYVNLPILRK